MGVKSHWTRSGKIIFFHFTDAESDVNRESDYTMKNKPAEKKCWGNSADP